MKTFIEIGTCDFDTNIDLIKSGEWVGIMVEPAPIYFNNLKKLVENSEHKDAVILENIAISDFDGKVEFAVAKDNTKSIRSENGWTRGISSIVSDNHKGERLFDYEENKKFLQEQIDVDCMTLQSLIKKHNLQNIDYLKIDVEGHETNILDAYDWSIKPTFIKLEHTHVDDIHIANLLKSKGYIVYTEERDIYAVG